MIVVADTSPLHYLILTEVADVLPELFGEVLIPEKVRVELTHAGAPIAVRDWMAAKPDWLRVQPVDWTTVGTRPDLDTGEAAAILLAEQSGLDVFLLVDDAKARREARRRHLATTGTLGVLRSASVAGMLRLGDVLPKLLKTNFDASE